MTYIKPTNGNRSWNLNHRKGGVATKLYFCPYLLSGDLDFSSMDSHSKKCLNYPIRCFWLTRILAWYIWMDLRLQLLTFGHAVCWPFDFSALNIFRNAEHCQYNSFYSTKFTLGVVVTLAFEIQNLITSSLYHS